MIALKEKPAFRPGNQKLQEYLDETYVSREKKVPIRGRALFRRESRSGLSCLRRRARTGFWWRR